MLGDFFDPAFRDLLGLDYAICWNLDSISRGDPSYYGDPVATAKLTDVEGAFVALGDDVLINENNPHRIAQYARGLISLDQLRELVLDCAHIEEDGAIFFDWPPHFGMFLLDDARYEVQTRGALKVD